MEQYTHYISRNVKSFYRKKLLSPVIYIIFLSFLWVHFSLASIVAPSALPDGTALDDYLRSESAYVTVSLSDLHFTGYTASSFGNTDGYYYYCDWNGETTLVLLSPHTSEEGLPQIESVSIRAKIEKRSDLEQTVLENLASDLSWTTSGINTKVTTYFFNEPDSHPITSVVLAVFCAASALYALLHLISCVVYMLFPHLCPSILALRHFGNPKELLAQAEEELATLPQLATEDMFITEHFFIEVAAKGIALVPISEILWIYKHSTLHKFLWYHFSISYTLSITANKHVYIQCPKNIKSDIDGIIDYLAEANHNILVGFSEENRLKIQKIQGTPFQIDKLSAALKRKL